MHAAVAVVIVDVDEGHSPTIQYGNMCASRAFFTLSRCRINPSLYPQVSKLLEKDNNTFK